MNNKQKKNLFTLKRRLYYLENRVLYHERGEELHFDRAEIRALRFAIACVEMCEVKGLVTSDTGEVAVVEQVERFTN